MTNVKDINTGKDMEDTNTKQQSHGVDESLFHIKSVDAKGHSTRMQFRCPNQFPAQVDEIIQAKKFPYRSSGELVRHALINHFKWMQDVEPGSFYTNLAQAEVIRRIMYDDDLASKFQENLDGLAARVAYFIGRGARGQAVRVVLDVQKALEEMPAGYWKDEYAKELRDKYGELMDKTPKALFTNMEEDE